MNLKLLIILAFCSIAASALRAETVDDIIALQQKNTAEDVMLATVEKSKTDFNLSVAEILKLKEANVPNSVISAMLKHHGAPAAAAPAPAPAPAQPAPAAPAPVPAPAPVAPKEDVQAGEGQLELENLDSKKWAYRYEPALKTIWIVRPTSDDRGILAANGGTTLRMNSGTYKIRYNGQDRGPSVTVFSGEKSTVMISRVDTPELEALYASVFEHNEKKPSGRLVILRENAPAAGSNDPHRGGEAAPPPDQRIVEREIVEAPVYVAPPPPPVIYAPYYRYPGPYYYPYNSVRFGYFHGGGHTRWGVGLGFGF